MFNSEIVLTDVVPSRYNLSKLLQLYIIRKLCAAIDPPTIVINSVDPCFCKTGLSGDLRGVARVFFKIFEFIAARTAEEGSRLVVQAASAGRQTHGKYLRAGTVQAYAPIALDDERAAYVWNLLCGKLETLQPGILQNI